jgi:copper chaperone CopZ
MKKIILCLLTATAFTACTSNKPKTETIITPTPTGIEGLQNNNAVNNTKTAPADNSNLIYNPAHGEAGHDCSIAVGALLKKNPQPAAVKVQPQPQSQTVTATQPVVATEKTSSKSEKLNPAHGQPGHDCAVAVGAPLSSKTKATVVTAPVTPVVENNKEVKSNGKINPAHGEAGHRCDIAVGAPLT